MTFEFASVGKVLLESPACIKLQQFSYAQAHDTAAQFLEAAVPDAIEGRKTAQNKRLESKGPSLAFGMYHTSVCQKADHTNIH